MTDAELWELEKAFWLEGPAFYRAWMHASAVMVFPAPVGILSGREPILATLKDAPRWRSVELASQTVLRVGEEGVFLAYRAEAARDGSGTYRALCGSTWCRTQEGWRLVAHQQTPLG
jgi:hypothetical protein